MEAERVQTSVPACSPATAQLRAEALELDEQGNRSPCPSTDENPKRSERGALLALAVVVYDPIFEGALHAPDRINDSMEAGTEN